MNIYDYVIDLEATDRENSFKVFSNLDTDFDKVVEVSQCEMGLSNSRREKPILVTYGLADCAALWGYDAKRKVGFLAHIHYLNKIDETLKSLAKTAQSDYGSVEFKCNAMGCDSTGLLRTLTESVRMWNNGQIFFDINSIYHKNANISGSVAIDTRTGNLFHYDPKNNPNSRLVFPHQILEEMAKADACKLVYH